MCRSDGVVQEIALGGLEKEDKELNQLDRAVFSKVSMPARETPDGHHVQHAWYLRVQVQGCRQVSFCVLCHSYVNSKA